MNKIKELVLDELRNYKSHLIGEIKKMQKDTREIDKRIKEILEAEDKKRGGK